MQKAKTIGIEDSNIAHLGGKEEHDARRRAAEGEKAYTDAGKKEGLEIWRVENLGINVWPKEKHGQFYSGDSYIVLKTNVDKKSGKFSWDAHFWLGKGTSIDERGVAAYKTVELDDLLGDAPRQHREIEGEESDLFVSYFKPAIIVLSGGVASGFSSVKPEEYVPRLLWCKGTSKAMKVSQCATTSCSELNHGDVFILDAGLQIWQWQGKESGAFERRKGAEISNALKADRPKAKYSFLDDGIEEDSDFWACLQGSKDDIKAAAAAGDDKATGEVTKKLFRLSDSTGDLTFTELGSGTIHKSDLDSSDVFIVDVGVKVFVWIGSKSTPAEKKAAMITAEKYLEREKRPSSLPITRVLEGTVDAEFEAAFGGK